MPTGTYAPECPDLVGSVREGGRRSMPPWLQDRVRCRINVCFYVVCVRVVPNSVSVSDSSDDELELGSDRDSGVW